MLRRAGEGSAEERGKGEACRRPGGLFDTSILLLRTYGIDSTDCVQINSYSIVLFVLVRLVDNIIIRFELDA